MSTHALAVSPAHRIPASRLPALLALVAAVFGSVLVSTPGSAEAATSGGAVVQEASRHHGQPYQYGAAGPSRFDCSGFTLYVYSRFGRQLPHNSQQQYNDVRHIARDAKQPGDLIFFPDSSGSMGHVGIYAGNGNMWDATHSGDVVRERAIYSSNYQVGRP